MEFVARHRVALRRALIVVALAAVAVGGAYVAMWRRAESRRRQLLNPLGFLNVSASARYVKDEACAECHQAISDSYAQTAMARSWSRPAAAQLIENFESPNEVTDPKTGFRYRAVRDGDRFFQREYRVDDQGQEVDFQVREVAYVLGSGTKGRSYVTDSNGYLTIMPIAWYSGEGRWDLNPGYREFNEGFDREVRPRCISCHNSYPDYVAGSSNRYREPVPEGIGCQRCHGPGQLHVAYRSGAARASLPADTLDTTIVNPAHLPPGLQQDVCLQCHLISTEGFFIRQGEAFDFRPGQPLAEFRSVFELSTGPGDDFKAVSHGHRVALSRCFTESAGKLTCTYCHDPHVSVSDVPRQYFNSRCTNCHGTEACTRSEPAPGDTDATEAHRLDDCVACHMPRGNPKDVEHTVISDHWIRRRPSALKTHEVTPRTSRYQDLLGQATAAETAMAQTGHGIKTRNTALISQSTGILTELVRRDPHDSRHRYWLANGLANLGRPRESLEHLQQAYRDLLDGSGGAMPDDERAALCLSLAETLLQRGRATDAYEVASHLRGTMPDYIPVYDLLAKIDMSEGRHRDAEQAVRAGLERNSASIHLWNRLGLKQLTADRRPTAAIESLRRSLSLNPRQPLVWTTLAQAHLQNDQSTQAEESLLQAIAMDKDYVPARLQLADLFVRTRRPAEAREQLERAASLAPGDPEIRRMLESLRTPQ